MEKRSSAIVKMKPSTAPKGSDAAIKTPISTTHSSDEQMIAKKGAASPYELVEPRKRRNIMESGRKWWMAKVYKERRKVLLKILVFFAVLIVLLITLIAAGAYLLINRRAKKEQAAEKIERRLDPRLTTKTSLCRATRPKTAECVYERKEMYGECSGDVCGQLEWEFRSARRNLLISFVRKETTFGIDNTDYADCGYPNWCVNGSCVPSGLKREQWWPSQNPFPPLVGAGSWRVHQSNRTPCIIIDGDDAAKGYNALIRKYFGRCNSDGCANMTMAALRVYFLHCDTSADRTTGIRKQPCKGEPIKVVRCYKCPTYTPENERKYRDDVCKTNKDKTKYYNDGCGVTCYDEAGKEVDWWLLDKVTCTKEPSSVTGVCVQFTCFVPTDEYE